MNIHRLCYASALAILCATSQAAPPKKPAAKPQPKPIAKAAPKPAASAPLPIDLPSGAQVELELDGTDDDLLGLVKSFARGLEQGNSSTGKKAPSSSPWVTLLGDKQLSAILKDVRHLHLVAYKLPHDDDDAPTMSTGTMMSGPTDAYRPTRAAKPLTMEGFNAVSFHERPMLAAKGRRSLQANMGRTRIQMFAFEATSTSMRGFGLIAQGPTRIIVARSEGYPDMAAVGRIINLGDDA